MESWMMNSWESFFLLENLLSERKYSVLSNGSGIASIMLTKDKKIHDCGLPGGVIP